MVMGVLMKVKVLFCWLLFALLAHQSSTERTYKTPMIINIDSEGLLKLSAIQVRL
jgi:hypothetical protein